MKKLLTTVLSVAFVFGLLFVSAAQDKITALDQLDGRTVAAPSGTVVDAIVLKKFPKARIVYYDTVSDCVAALKSGAVDATVADEPIVRVFLKDNPELAILPDLLSTDAYAFAVNPKRQDVRASLNSILTALRADGNLDKMTKRWFDTAGPEAVLPDIIIEPADGQKLVFATSSQLPPFSFKNRNGAIVGLDVELATLVAKDMKASLRILDLSFDDMLAAVNDGRADLAGACLTVTPERAERFLLSEPYYSGGMAVLVRQ